MNIHYFMNVCYSIRRQYCLIWYVCRNQPDLLLRHHILQDYQKYREDKKYKSIESHFYRPDNGKVGVFQKKKLKDCSKIALYPWWIPKRVRLSNIIMTKRTGRRLLRWRMVNISYKICNTCSGANVLPYLGRKAKEYRR